MIIKINDYISYIEPTENPLSANVVIIEGKEYFWIYDVGNNPEWIDILNGIGKNKNVILSHFHPDHIGNFEKIDYEKLYVGKNTFKYTKTGEIVTEDILIEDGDVVIKIMPIPSSHAKGSLALEVNETFLFIGDAAYCTRKGDNIVHNAEQLLGLIRKIETSKAKYVLCSHDTQFIKTKEAVITELKNIYAKRQKNEPYIMVRE